MSGGEALADDPIRQNLAGNDSPTPLSGRKERAALLVAEDELSNEQIAAEIGIARQTLDAWKRNGLFADRVERIREDIRAAVLAQGIANKQYRIDAANDRHKAFTEIVRQRAELHTHDEGGADTGWLVRTYKFSPMGERFEEWSVDTGLNAAMSALEKQVAQETGQWAESPAGSQGIRVQLVGVDISRLTGETAAGGDG